MCYKGYKASAETKAKQSKAHLGIPTGRSGKKSHLYIDGRSDGHNIVRRRKAGPISVWRAAVFERDGYKCCHCGKAGNRDYGINKIGLDACHIEPFSLHPELRFDVSNGITLCRDCHRKHDQHSQIEVLQNFAWQHERWE